MLLAPIRAFSLALIGYAFIYSMEKLVKSVPGLPVQASWFFKKDLCLETATNFEYFGSGRLATK
jgi:hypothetical protein